MANLEVSRGPTTLSDVVWLDCTLRDGGYQNNWEFEDSLTNRYLQAMMGARADRVELGFRTLSNEGYRGATAFTSDSFLDSLTIPEGLSIGVMVNVSELGSSPELRHTNLSRLFPSSSRKHVSFVRLAAHLSEIEQAVDAARWLSSRDYEVGLNVMQISEASDAFIASLGTLIPQAGVDVLYVADSLGSLNPGRTAETISLIRRTWSGPMGFHAHDNLGLALANSLAAVEAGATWIDSTVFGMGRGAGNTRSEILLGHLSQLRDGVAVSELQHLIDDYFQPLSQSAAWGPNFHYARAALRGIHPTFVQELTAHDAYSYAEQSAAIDSLSNSNSQKFSEEKLNEALTWVNTFESPKSSWNQSDLFFGSTVLLVGAGQSLESHAGALQTFIGQEKPITVATNLGGMFNEELINARIACHPLRIIGDAPQYAAVKVPLIAPSSFLPETLAKKLSENDLFFDVGLARSAESVAAEPGLVSIPSPQVLAYSLLVCLSGGAERIYLAGFDGYREGDSRRQLEQKLMNSILNAGFAGDLIAITPTQFDVEQVSVHGLLR